MLKGVFPFFQQVEPKPHLVLSRGLRRGVWLARLRTVKPGGGAGRVNSAAGSKRGGSQGGNVSQRTGR